ncbi:MAG: SMP-30/gluconolactonase/LRE family protein [Melioribacteraceae bacterium]|jgi:gluconolactonase|nr:SMP-30/gluconolactonase/LRE family protein [Melioribacteraceae bacterium]
MKKYTNQFFSILYILIITQFNNVHAQSPIPAGAKLERIASGILQPEGPVWKENSGLLFSDIKAAKIYLWSPDNNSISTYLQKSDSSNGLTYDDQGRLILTQMGKRRISRQELNGTITPIASTYLGKKFNSPNDLVVKSDGSIFFTDPDFNIPFGGTKEIMINGVYVKGIYRISKNGNVQLLDGTFDKPNGICFSPDEKKIYVNESPKGEIYEWDVINDSMITNKKLLYKIPVNGYVDGMKTDKKGNLYITGPTGVWIVSPSGVYLDKIALPNNQSGSNCAWGEADRKTLYITTSASAGSVYKIRLADITGLHETDNNIPQDIHLFQNYPNPFNPETVISWNLNIGSFVTLKIFDALGKEIETIVDEFQDAGIHHARFSTNGSNYSTGVYFYQLEAGSYSQTKKMLIVK